MHASSQCHVTPPVVAARMVGYLEALPSMMTLEPHAGTGNLIAALIDSGHETLEICAIERERELYNLTAKRFNWEICGFNDCFLEYAARTPAGSFPRILMNPPFKGIKAHMDAAIRLLGPAGHDDAVLVALVPVTYSHPQAVTLEVLDLDTFATARVNTKIIRIEK